MAEMFFLFLYIFWQKQAQHYKTTDPGRRLMVLSQLLWLFLQLLRRCRRNGSRVGYSCRMLLLRLLLLKKVLVCPLTQLYSFFVKDLFYFFILQLLSTISFSKADITEIRLSEN